MDLISSMDLLSEILQTIKLRGTVYFHARFQSPWGMEIPSGEYANYHIVTEGNCWVELEDTQAPIQLHKGDMILFPNGNNHSLADSPQTNTVSAEELISKPHKTDSKALTLGGDGSYSASLICGHFEYDKESAHPLFETLPSFIYIRAKTNKNSEWFATASVLATQISTGNSVGKKAVINRLAESIFIQALADYVESMDNPENFIGAIQNRNIGRVLKAMHNDIAHDWCLSELASIAAMSKSVFSAKFHTMVGKPPIIYLAHWRMLKAKQMLSDTTIPISKISEEVGYLSEFSFSRAFKKMTGSAPGAIRKNR